MTASNWFDELGETPAAEVSPWLLAAAANVSWRAERTNVASRWLRPWDSDSSSHSIAVNKQIQ